MSFYDDIKAPGGAFKFYVNGEWKESSSGKTQAILNPSDNQPVFQVQGVFRAGLLPPAGLPNLEPGPAITTARTDVADIRQIAPVGASDA